MDQLKIVPPRAGRLHGHKHKFEDRELTHPRRPIHIDRDHLEMSRSKVRPEPLQRWVEDVDQDMYGKSNKVSAGLF